MQGNTNTITMPGGSGTTRPSSPYTLATLYALHSHSETERFDAFRTGRGRPAYFHKEVCASTFLVDGSDCDELDLAFLLGMEARKLQGIRMPWNDVNSYAVQQNPRFLSLSACLNTYAVWHDSHALFAVKHAFLLLIGDFLDRADALPVDADVLTFVLARSAHEAKAR